MLKIASRPVSKGGRNRPKTAPVPAYILRTASSTVLQALPGIDEATAEAIVNARDADPPVRDLNQLLGTAGMNPAAAQQAMRYFDGPGHGNTYKVTITATIGQLSHTYTAIIFRDGRLVSIYNFYRSE